MDYLYLKKLHNFLKVIGIVSREKKCYNREKSDCVSGTVQTHTWSLCLESLQSTETRIYSNNLTNTNKITIVENAMGVTVEELMQSDKSGETFLKVSYLT